MSTQSSWSTEIHFNVVFTVFNAALKRNTVGERAGKMGPKQSPTPAENESFFKGTRRSTQRENPK